LDDGMVRHLDRDRFAQVLAPKLAGAWHLHQLAEPLALDFFVLYSSFTAVLGTPGQGNHAAANAFLDALAWHRRGKGLPALSIDWGAWSNVGAAAQRQIGERLRNKGAALLTPEHGMRLLERVWHAETAQIAVVPIHWQAVRCWLASRVCLLPRPSHPRHFWPIGPWRRRSGSDRCCCCTCSRKLPRCSA
jgi:hypothetical protein